MEAHANVRDMGLIEAKLAYIKGWQALPEFGVSYFVIKMANGKKEVGESEVQNTVNSNIFVRVLFLRNLAYAKFRENKILAKWRNHSVDY